MAIEKMLLVNIHGAQSRLDEILTACSDVGCFHPESVKQLAGSSKSMMPLAQDNPYSATLAKVRELARAANIPLKYDKARGAAAGAPDLAFLTRFSDELNSLLDAKIMIESDIQQQNNALRHLAHINNMDISLDELFASRFVKVRFGRLPADSRSKLRFYDNELFFFYEFDFDSDYYWGFYLTTEEYTAVIDNIFNSLFFERIYIPEYAHGTPRLASEHLMAAIQSEQEELQRNEKSREALIAQNLSAFTDLYSRILYLTSAYEIRKYVAISNDGEQQTFHMVGFIPKREQAQFAAAVSRYTEVTVNFMPPETDPRFTPPTRLHNHPLVRPFEMFVTMYGMPSQQDIDPTPLVAITYSLLFGAMFGDLGQGLLLCLLGLLVSKKTGSALGGILVRVGVCSAGFGLLYGSVFGNETLLEPLYHALGIGPIQVMNGATINQILILAVAAGAVMILLAICINIIQGIKQHDAARAVFDANGIAGLLLYSALLVGFVLQMFFHIHVFVPLYIILFVVLPAMLIFLKEPCLKLLRHAKHIAPADGIGSYIAESFFELFEVFLSFAANTMSFLRVGGFVLSHAGMMLVVYTLADMLQGAAIPVLILGNLFVMALEGMIVGIQVLRLEFYEIFSRFYHGDGVPFAPIVLETE